MLDELNFEGALRTVPPHYGVQLAVRSTLRAIPIAANLFEDRGGRSTPVLQIFRATASAWIQASNSQRNIGSNAARASDAAAQIAHSISNEKVMDLASAASLAVHATTSDADNPHTASLCVRHAHKAVALPEFWAAFEADMSLLKLEKTPSSLANFPLWDDEITSPLTTQWSKLKGDLLALAEGWGHWLDWYDHRLLGTYLEDPDVELARIVIPDRFWRMGPVAANERASKQIEEVLIGLTPQAETMSIHTADATITIDTSDVEKDGTLDNSLSKVRDRVIKIQERIDENQFSSLKNVLSEIDFTIEKYSNKPRRIHDDFETYAINVQTKIDSKEVAEDDLVLNLQRDLETAIMDCRIEIPDIARLAEARSKIKVKRLSKDELRQIEQAVNAAADISEPELADELISDFNNISTEDDKEPAEHEVPEGETKSAAYRLGGRLLRIRRLVSDKQELKLMFRNAISASENVDKLAKGGAWIAAGAFLIYRLLGF